MPVDRDIGRPRPGIANCVIVIKLGTRHTLRTPGYKLTTGGRHLVDRVREDASTPALHARCGRRNRYTPSQPGAQSYTRELGGHRGGSEANELGEQAEELVGKTGQHYAPATRQQQFMLNTVFFWPRPLLRSGRVD